MLWLYVAIAAYACICLLQEISVPGLCSLLETIVHPTRSMNVFHLSQGDKFDFLFFDLATAMLPYEYKDV